MRVTYLLLTFIAACAAAGSWKILDVDRNVDLTTQIIKTTSLITFESTATKEQNSLLLALPVDESNHVAYAVVREDGQKQKLKITKQNVEKGLQLYKIDLPRSLALGEKIKLKVETRVTEFLTPFPATIAQRDSQYIKATVTSHFPAAYPVAKEKTSYKVAGNVLEGGRKKETTSGKVVYGPYTDQPAFNAKFVDLHYECNFPFVVATVVERTIEVSHWGGNIAVEEYIELENKGAGLKGTFSRLDHSSDRRPQTSRPHLQHFTTILPASAKDIYYRDEIGNISTSAVRVRADSVEVTVTPRFPLFGGWRTSYVIGYNVPSYEYINFKDNHYALKMHVLSHIFDNIVVEKLTTKVILPEHARNVKVSTPFTMERLPDSLKASYLDFNGRVVVTLAKDNLVSEQIQSFTVNYDFDSIDLLREPAMAVCFFFVIFFSVIVYVRFDFSLSSNSAAQMAEELSGHTRKLEALASRKTKLYCNLVDEVTNFKDTREETILHEAKETLAEEREAVNNAIQDVLGQMKTKFAIEAEKASELVKYDKVLFDSVDGYISHTIKSKQKTSPEDSKFAEKAVEARRRAERLIDSLHSSTQ